MFKVISLVALLLVGCKNNEVDLAPGNPNVLRVSGGGSLGYVHTIETNNGDTCYVMVGVNKGGISCLK